MLELEIGVCQGRHEIPCKRFIFPQEVNPLEVKELESQAYNCLRSFGLENGLNEDHVVYLNIPNQQGYYDILGYRFAACIKIYVTGLTVAVIAAVKAAKALYERVELLHYNRDTDSYYIQSV